MSEAPRSSEPRVCRHIRSGERRVRFLSTFEPGRFMYWCGDREEMQAAERDEAAATALFPADPSFRPDLELRAFEDLPARWSVGRHEDDEPWRVWSHQPAPGEEANVSAYACVHVARGARISLVVSKDGSLVFACGDDGDRSFENLSPSRFDEIVAADSTLRGLQSLPDRWSLMRGTSENSWIVKPRSFDERQPSHVRGTNGPDGLDESERRCVGDVAKEGLHVLHVSRSGEDDGYSYTVGLFERFGHAEVVVFGQSADWRFAALRSLVDELRKGKRFAAGDRHEELLPGFVCKFRSVTAYESYRDKLGWVLWYYVTYKKMLGPEPAPALQLVYPDRKGRYPGERGYETRWRQPLLP